MTGRQDLRIELRPPARFAPVQRCLGQRSATNSLVSENTTAARPGGEFDFQPARGSRSSEVHQLNVKTSMGFATPRSSNDPSPSIRASFPTASTKSSDSRTGFFVVFVSFSSLEARFTAGPITVKSSLFRDPILPYNSPLLPRRDHKWKIPVPNGLNYWGHVRDNEAAPTVSRAAVRDCASRVRGELG